MAGAPPMYGLGQYQGDGDGRSLWDLIHGAYQDTLGGLESAGGALNRWQGNVVSDLASIPSGLGHLADSLFSGETTPQAAAGDTIRGIEQRWDPRHILDSAYEHPGLMGLDLASFAGAAHGLGTAEDFVRSPGGLQRLIQEERGGTAPTGPPSGTGHDRIRGTDPRMGDIVDRIGRGYRDNATPSEIRPASVRGRGQVQLGWDDNPADYAWHYSPEENFAGIRERGFDPRLAGKHGDFARGTHFSDSPHTYEPTGDIPYNVYRVRRDAVENPVHRSQGDFYTERPIRPEAIEVYEGPGKFGKVRPRVDPRQR